MLRIHRNAKVFLRQLSFALFFPVLLFSTSATAQIPNLGEIRGTQATTGPSPATNLSTLDLSEQMAQNPYTGSVSTEKPVPGSVSITLLDAIDRGLKYNLGLYTSQTSQQAVTANRLRALSELLPNVNAGAVESIQQINLAVFGLSLPGSPRIVGPFAVNDLRATLTAPIYDATLINRYRAAKHNVEAAQYNYRNSRELVVVVVGLSYVQALAAEARVDTVQAQLNTAEALYRQALDQKNAGVAPAIDVLRAQVEMQAQQQRLVFAKNALATEKLRLARIIGLPVAQEFTLAQKIPYSPVPPLELEEAIGRALRERPDYAVAQSLIRAAERSYQAATDQRLPSVVFAGDYGVIGRTLASNHGTFTAQAGIRVPIFQGGRIKGDIQQADAVLKQRKAEAEDMRGRIEYEVRTAFLDLAAAAEQVRVAQSTVELATQTLTQAQDRFRAGVTNNLEVVQAQETLAGSNDAFINSTLQYNLAKLALARSLGIAERATKEFLGGTP